MNSHGAKKFNPLFPWEREGLARQGIHALPRRASRTATVRSKPKIPGQEYLEVYLKTMEKARLAMLGRTFGRLLREKAKQWESAALKLRQMEESFPAGRKETDQMEIYRGG